MIEAFAVAVGGAAGSLGRWGIGRALGAVLPGLPAGDLRRQRIRGLGHRPRERG